MRFSDREEAGQELGRVLGTLPREGLTVLGLARGGVPVAYQVSRALKVPLDVLSVRKLGAPHRRELALGAIASGGVEVLHERSIELLGVSPQALSEVITVEEKEMARREREFRRDRAALDVAGRTVVLVDDGMATGATMTAAVQAVRKMGAKSVIVAVPTASREACEMASTTANECRCLSTPEPYFAVGYWYDNFRQVADTEVRRLLLDRDSEIAASRA